MTRLCDDALQDLRIVGARIARHGAMVWRQAVKALNVAGWLLRDLLVGACYLLIFLVYGIEALLSEPKRKVEAFERERGIVPLDMRHRYYGPRKAARP